MVSDNELLDKFKTNPESGFQLIVEQFQERVYWQIRRIVKNHDDSADVMQNVFIKVWKALPDFRGDSALYTWIYRIAFNETHTFLSRESKKKTVDMDPPLFENAVEVSGKNYSPEEIEELFNRALETLPEKQKLVFTLRYFDELKFQEIEAMLGTSVGALKASYHLAAKKIEDFLKAY
ncbi:MAG: sigma-70 family RNA polymerase sigma factor [Bacteroidetes bacterium]|nr:sigma-70 family RNA polymerase sigma factor [Bacteroidota bacterium]